MRSFQIKFQPLNCTDEPQREVTCPRAHSLLDRIDWVKNSSLLRLSLLKKLTTLWKQ